MKKICLVSSSGGHFEQLLMLKKLSENYSVFFVTEQTKYSKRIEDKCYSLVQVNRKELLFPVRMIMILIKSIAIYLKEKPDVVISTGALATIPMMVIGHLSGKKVIYIESFAKTTSPTMTGSFVYKRHIADQFYVQWETMKKVYPDAIYKGRIY